MLKKSLFTLAVALCSSGQVGAQVRNADACEVTASPAVVSWLRRNAVPLKTTRADRPWGDLRRLQHIVGDSRVVGLGESIHGAQEFFAIRHRLLRFLVEEMGFTAFAMETGFAEAARINDYVLGRGEEPDRWEHNWFTWGFGAEEELQSLVRWMRSYNADPRNVRKLRFYGVDIPVSYSSPRAALTGAVRYLEQVDSEFAISTLRQRLEDLVSKFEGSGGSDEARGISLRKYRALPVETRDGYAAALSDLINRYETHRPDYISASSPEAYGWAYRHAVVARQMDTAFRAKTRSDREVSNTRDRAIADNTLWALEQEGADGRVVLWAHNWHLQKNRSMADTSESSATPLTRAGEHLRSSLGRKYVSIGFSYQSGSDRGWMDYQRNVGDPARCGSLDAELDRVGLPMYIVDLRRAPSGAVVDWLKQPRPQRGEYSYPLVNAFGAWDVVLHMHRITPARRRTR